MHTETGSSHHHHDNVTQARDADTVTALLNYLLEHNQQHVEELHSLAHQLTNLGLKEAADATDQALSAYRQGNKDLAHAVSLL